MNTNLNRIRQRRPRCYLGFDALEHRDLLSTGSLIQISGRPVSDPFAGIGLAARTDSLAIFSQTHGTDPASVFATAFSTISSPASVALDSGGGAAGSFAADADFTGGTVYTTADPIDTSGVTNPAPQAVYQTERYGNFTYTVPGLTPGANYTVRLHFAEIYWGGPGQRLFNVAINGTPVLSNFDIYATAGGKDKALVEQFTATADAQGRITIVYTTIRDNAKSSGIEILPASAPPTRVAIDSGYGAVGAFAADADFTGGNLYTTDAAIDTSGVINPAPQAVYQTERYGNFTYNVPGLTPGANYTVRLHFAEIYWNSAGQRLFNVAINGTQVLSNFDIYATVGGENKALVEQFTATADTSGQITIAYTTVKDNAKSSGIEIIPVDVHPQGYSGPVIASGQTSDYLNISQLTFDPSDPNHLYAARYASGSATSSFITRYDYNPATGQVSNPTTVLTVGGASLGIAFFNNDLYITTNNINTNLGGIIRYESGPSGTFINPVEFVNNIPFGLHNVDKLQVVGNSLYVGIGTQTDTGINNTQGIQESGYNGTIARIVDLTKANYSSDGANNLALSQVLSSLDPGKLLVYASGFRNPFGLLVTPSGQVWATDNGQESPATSDYLYKGLRQGDKGVFPTNNPGNLVNPLATLGLHTAATGLAIIPAGGDAGSLLVGLFHHDLSDPNPTLGNEVVLVDPNTGTVSPALTSLTSVTDIITDSSGRILLADFGPNFDNGYDPNSGGIFELAPVPESRSTLNLSIRL